MIEIGKYNTTIWWSGFVSGNPEQDPEGIWHLLPNKYVPNEFEIGEELIVFVYLDHEERIKVYHWAVYLLNEFHFACELYQIGAFMDWEWKRYFGSV
jgi:predicted RNA-binding protein (virulence factor B family)